MLLQKIKIIILKTKLLIITTCIKVDSIFSPERHIRF